MSLVQFSFINATQNSIKFFGGAAKELALCKEVAINDYKRICQTQLSQDGTHIISIGCDASTIYVEPVNDGMFRENFTAFDKVSAIATNNKGHLSDVFLGQYNGVIEQRSLLSPNSSASRVYCVPSSTKVRSLKTNAVDTCLAVVADDFPSPVVFSIDDVGRCSAAPAILQATVGTTPRIQWTHCAFNWHNPTQLATGANNGIIRLFDVKPHRSISLVSQSDDDAIVALEFSPINDQVLLSLNSSSSVSLFDVKASRPLIHRFPLPQMAAAKPTCMAIRDDATVIAIGTSVGDTYLFDVRHRRLLQHIVNAEQHQPSGASRSAVHSVAFVSPNATNRNVLLEPQTEPMVKSTPVSNGGGKVIFASRVISPLSTSNTNNSNNSSTIANSFQLTPKAGDRQVSTGLKTADAGNQSLPRISEEDLKPSANGLKTDGINTNDGGAAVLTAISKLDTKMEALAKKCDRMERMIDDVRDMVLRVRVDQFNQSQWNTEMGDAIVNIYEKLSQPSNNDAAQYDDFPS